MKHDASTIIKELNIKDDVLNIYSYGSQIYGTATNESDYDYIIVTKNAMLSSGAFKQNAISNKDLTIQGVIYSRSGFIDAINNYEIGAIECLSLNDNQIIQKKWPFKIQKWNTNEMIRKIISKASNSWYIADEQAKTGHKDRAKRGVFHVLKRDTHSNKLLMEKKVKK